MGEGLQGGVEDKEVEVVVGWGHVGVGGVDAGGGGDRQVDVRAGPLVGVRASNLGRDVDFRDWICLGKRGWKRVRAGVSRRAGACTTVCPQKPTTKHQQQCRCTY